MIQKHITKRAVKSAIALSILAAASAPAMAAQPITGQWITEEKDAIVEIAPCGASICGKIVKYLVPTESNPQLDDNNPNPKLRKRLLTKVNLLSGFKNSKSNWKGKIYDPKSGKTYKSKVSLSGPNKLNVAGCILFFCQTQKWTRK